MYSLLLTAAGALFFGSATPTAASTPKPATHTVVIEGLQFNPQVLTVKAGDTVVWINHDPFPHTATAQGGMFDSRKIATGRSWKYTVRKVGVFPYACTLHPTMLATLRVE
jgi:plastocyanin